MSATHARDLILAVAGPDTVTCDIEPAIARSGSIWRDLLGPDRWELAQFIMHETGEDVTRGGDSGLGRQRMLDESRRGSKRSLGLCEARPRGRDVLLDSGSLAIATFVLPDRNGQDFLVVGLLTSHDDAIL